MNNERIYNFTGGMPDPDTFPTQGLIDATARALTRLGGHRMVQYPGDKGAMELRQVAAKRFEEAYGVEIDPNDVAITNGSMQALDLIFRAFAESGDTVFTEHLTYMGTLGILRHRRSNLVGIPVDEDGLDTDALESLLRRHSPTILNIVPVNQNPTGRNLSESRKQRLLELSNARDLLILEDECYADIHFGAPPPKPLYGRANAGNVIYVGTFSKIVAPGLRLGYVIAPSRLMTRILAERWDNGTSAFASVILAEYLNDHLWEHVKKLTESVRAKRDTLTAALEKHGKPDVQELHGITTIQYLHALQDNGWVDEVGKNHANVLIWLILAFDKRNMVGSDQEVEVPAHELHAPTGAGLYGDKKSKGSLRTLAEAGLILYEPGNAKGKHGTSARYQISWRSILSGINCNTTNDSLFQCNPPDGGMFSWVKIPDDTNMQTLMATLQRRNVICTPGRAFDVRDRDIPYVRFSFGYPTHDEIDEGIAIFADAVRHAR
ncbi:MAG: PLP-dependent aminotransferase family protein [Candidatus Poribacteria bacterium]|nr:PLP-dependent aminotransferase family protein [Candidatus Poribacteria bacterium]